MAFPVPSRHEMDGIFALCRSDDWRSVHRLVQLNPAIATTPMIMDNHIATTVTHQAITSKADTQERACVIARILTLVPQAAAIRNGYGSLPLHVISQRNTKMDSQTKEDLIYALIRAYPRALMEEGGVGRRTPLHIAFTDYISPQLARFMIGIGSEATRIQDKKGWLPIHVACSRHCSPEKLRMLLEANPSSLYAKTRDGQSLMDLAKATATKSHPNFALIAELEKQLGIFKWAGSPKNSRKKAEAADLLLHFSRSSAASSPFGWPEQDATVLNDPLESIGRVAQV